MSEPDENQQQPVDSAGEVSSVESSPDIDSGDDDSLVSGSAVRAEAIMLERAIGGWRGVFDSAFPSLVYLLVYFSSGNLKGALHSWFPNWHFAVVNWLYAHKLIAAVGAALIAGVLIAIYRVSKKRSTLQIAGGLVGVGISAVITLTSHQARGFFLYGMILNAVYGTAFLASLLVNRPLLGYLVGAATGDPTGWLKDKQLRRVYAAATWIWVFVFGIRLLVRVPLYLANAVGWLGITGIAMGWPLYLLAAWFTYLLLAPALKAKRERDKAAKGESDDSTEDAALDDTANGATPEGDAVSE